MLNPLDISGEPKNLPILLKLFFTTLCEGWFDTFFDVKSKKLTSNFSFAKSIPYICILNKVFYKKGAPF